MTASGVPPSLISTLPGRAYVDPGLFADEQRLIFESMWFAVARAGDLAAPGAFHTAQVGRESILLTRTRDGDLRAFFNVCRHRGARLCTESSGTTGRTLRCAYHAWTYDLDGTLVAAPNMATMPGVDRWAYSLLPVPLREWLGYAWVCLADRPPSFEDEVIGAATARLGDTEAITHYEVADLALGRRITYDVRANWKLLVENFQECYHCAIIHPELVAVLPEFVAGYAAQYYVGHGALFGDRIAGFTVDGSPGLTRIPSVTPEQDRRYFAITVVPQVFINLLPDHVVFHRMCPVAVDRTVVVCDWLVLPSVVEAGTDLGRTVELFDRVNRQDFGACERTQPGMSSRAYARGGVLVPTEHHIAAFHDWWRDLLGGAGLSRDDPADG